MSKELRAYLTAWYRWATSGGHMESGFHTNYGFSKRYGLCASCPSDCDVELEEMFVADGLDRFYPFNNGDATEYRRDSRMYAMHLNPKRLEWVRSKINAA